MKLSYHPHYKQLSDRADTNAKRIYWLLRALPRHRSLHPIVCLNKPRIWHVQDRFRERVFMRVMGDALGTGIVYSHIEQSQRLAYWVELERGRYPQEKASEFGFRCIRALLLGVVSNLGDTYEQAREKGALSGYRR